MSYPSDPVVHLEITRTSMPSQEPSQSSDTVIATGVQPTHNEESHLFSERPASNNSLTSEQAFMHMCKAMLGAGVLSLPLAFKQAGLYLGLILLVIICGICLYAMRLIVFAAHDVCRKTGREFVDYANIMAVAVDHGPRWIRSKRYFFKQLVNSNVFLAQLGFCCVYFVFMADNLEDFFRRCYDIVLPKSVWMILIAFPVMAICSIRNLNRLAPFAMVANVIYLGAVGIVVYCLFTNLKSADQLTKFGSIRNLPMFFSMALYSFEGVSVVMVIENRMQHPQMFIAWNGVLNTSCAVVMAIFAVIGFYGYLAFGDDTKDTITLNLPDEPFYQALKIMFVLCVLVSYPIQFFVPLERVEKFITRKAPVEKHTLYSYGARFALVLTTLIIAEVVPHLGLFIALMGAVACSVLALLFPAIIDLLLCYSNHQLTLRVLLIDSFLIGIFFLGFTTGGYLAMSDILKTFQ